MSVVSWCCLATHMLLVADLAWTVNGFQQQSLATRMIRLDYSLIMLSVLEVRERVSQRCVLFISSSTTRSAKIGKQENLSKSGL